MPRQNDEQPELIPDPRIEAIPDHFALTPDILRQWSDLPEQDRSWELMADVTNALNEIDGQHAELKKSTIRNLVWAQLNNQSARSVFERPDCCNESTWHKRWKHDPLIRRVLAYVSSAAKAFTTAQEAVAMMEAKRAGQQATPYAANVLISMLGEKPEIALRAAIELLKLTGVFDESNPALNLTINNTAAAAASAEAEMTLAAWKEQADKARQEAAEAASLAAAFGGIEEEDDDADPI